MLVERRRDEPFEKFLRRFNRKVKEAKLFTELKEKSYYRSKSQKRRDAIRRNKNRSYKENDYVAAKENPMEIQWEE